MRIVNVADWNRDNPPTVRRWESVDPIVGSGMVVAAVSRRMRARLRSFRVMRKSGADIPPFEESGMDLMYRPHLRVLPDPEFEFPFFVISVFSTKLVDFWNRDRYEMYRSLSTVSPRHYMGLSHVRHTGKNGEYDGRRDDIDVVMSGTGDHQARCGDLMNFVGREIVPIMTEKEIKRIHDRAVSEDLSPLEVFYASLLPDDVIDHVRKNCHK